MGEPIEERGGHLGIPEHRCPFAEAEIGCDDHTGALVELACLINSGGFRGIGSHCPPRHLWRAMAAVGS